MSPASRLSQARQAVRPALKGRMMLSGPPGAGKTRTALIMASELAEGGRILMIDTERESALTYADDFAFEHLPWLAPYPPHELRETIDEASGKYAVVIVDSLSHFWRKEGGVLDIAGGRFTGWKEARPAQEALVESILGCNAHVLLCVRSKVAYAQTQDATGKHQVEKLGMADQQDEDLAYEMNVAIELAMDHTATVTKSRTTALPVNRGYGIARTAEMARVYRDWLKAGEPPAPTEVVQDLRARMDVLPEGLRKQVKAEFFGSYGRPEQLRESRVEHAEALVARYETAAGALASTPETPIEAGGDDGSDRAGSPAASTVAGRASASSSEAGSSDPERPAPKQVEEDGTTPPVTGPSSDATRKITKAQAARLHTVARDLDESVLRVLIHAATGARSDSASDVPSVQYDQLVADVTFACDGRLPADYTDWADAWAAWREARHGDAQLDLEGEPA